MMNPLKGEKKLKRSMHEEKIFFDAHLLVGKFFTKNPIYDYYSTYYRKLNLQILHLHIKGTKENTQLYSRPSRHFHRIFVNLIY